MRLLFIVFQLLIWKVHCYTAPCPGTEDLFEEQSPMEEEKLDEEENEERQFECGKYEPPQSAFKNGGSMARESQVPSAVSIDFDGEQACTGTLISHRHVLTAAHCIDSAESRQEIVKRRSGTKYHRPDLDRMVVMTGIHSLRSTTGRPDQVRSVTEIAYPSKYYDERGVLPIPDIAILLLNQTVRKTPACVQSMDQPRPGRLIISAGFGRRTIRGRSSPVMRVETGLLTTDCPGARHNYLVFCTSPVTMYMGDSGSGILWRNSTVNRHVVGGVLIESTDPNSPVHGFVNKSVDSSYFDHWICALTGICNQQLDPDVFSDIPTLKWLPTGDGDIWKTKNIKI